MELRLWETKQTCLWSHGWDLNLCSLWLQFQLAHPHHAASNLFYEEFLQKRVSFLLWALGFVLSSAGEDGIIITCFTDRESENVKSKNKLSSLPRPEEQPLTSEVRVSWFLCPVFWSLGCYSRQQPLARVYMWGELMSSHQPTLPMRKPSCRREAFPRVTQPAPVIAEMSSCMLRSPLPSWPMTPASACMMVKGRVEMTEKGDVELCSGKHLKSVGLLRRLSPLQRGWENVFSKGGRKGEMSGQWRETRSIMSNFLWPNGL